MKATSPRRKSVRFSIMKLSPEHVIPKNRYSIAAGKHTARPSVLAQPLLPISEIHEINREAFEEERLERDEIQNQTKDLEQPVEGKQKSGMGFCPGILLVLVVMSALSIAILPKLQVAPPEPVPEPEPTFFETYWGHMFFAGALLSWGGFAAYLNLNKNEKKKKMPPRRMSEADVQVESIVKEKLMQDRKGPVFIIANLEGAKMVEEAACDQKQLEYVSLYAHCDPKTGEVLRERMQDASIPVVHTSEGSFEAFVEHVASESDMFDFYMKNEHGEILVLADLKQAEEIRSVLPPLQNQENYSHFVIQA